MFRIIIVIATILLSGASNALGASSKSTTSACETGNLPKIVQGLCTTPLFKSYISCIEKSIPNWDPKGPVLSKRADFPAANAVLAVLMECEPKARAFGKKYGNEFANILQSVANRKASGQYGTLPLIEPSGDTSKFLEYGEHIKPTELKRGDLHDDRSGGFRRPLAKKATQVRNLLIKACKLRIDGADVPCETVWFVDFNDGESSVQFNRQTGDRPMVSFFGKDGDPNTLLIENVIVKVGTEPDESEATGQCILGKTEATCQARLSDGRMVIGTIFLGTSSNHM